MLRHSALVETMGGMLGSRSLYWNQPITRPKVSRISKSVRAGIYDPEA